MEQITTQQAQENKANEVPREYYEFIIRCQSELIKVLEKRNTIIEEFLEDVNPLIQKRK